MDANTTNTNRKPLTLIKWDTVKQISRKDGLGWPEQSDLAHELAGRTHLTVDQARVLVSAAENGLPVDLTWKASLSEGATETKTTAVIVDSLEAPHPVHMDSVPGMVRLRYWGFSHYVYLPNILDAKAPEVAYSYAKES